MCFLLFFFEFVFLLFYRKGRKRNTFIFHHVCSLIPHKRPFSTINIKEIWIILLKTNILGKLLFKNKLFHHFYSTLRFSVSIMVWRLCFLSWLSLLVFRNLQLVTPYWKNRSGSKDVCFFFFLTCTGVLYQVVLNVFCVSCQNCRECFKGVFKRFQEDFTVFHGYFHHCY